MINHEMLKIKRGGEGQKVDGGRGRLQTIGMQTVQLASRLQDLPISCCSTARSSSARRPVVAGTAVAAGTGAGGAAAAAACFSNIDAFCSTEARERSSVSGVVDDDASVIFSTSVAALAGGVGELI